MRTLANANLCGFGNARLGVADMHVCECMCRCMHTCFAFVYESGEVLGSGILCVGLSVCGC
jgi:hypothetical protein